MSSISTPVHVPPKETAPPVVYGLVYGVMASMVMWAAIAAVVYEFL